MKQTPKQKFLKLYPDAICIKWNDGPGDIYEIWVGTEHKEYIADGLSSQTAWKNALYEINN